MKQSNRTATYQEQLVAFIVIVTVALALFASACATLPRKASSQGQLSLESPKVGESFEINLNTASAVELEKLPGIGKAIAERIVNHREHYGPFRRPEHLMMVRGISDQKFRAIRSMIKVE